MINEYFYKLKDKLFTEQFSKDITEFCFNNLDKFVSYTGQRTRVKDGNNYYYGPFLLENLEIQKYIKSATLRCFPIIMLHYPNTKVIKHIDNQNKRNCVLACPIYPIFNYSPTFFYSFDDLLGPLETWEEQKPPIAGIANFENGLPILLNTQLPHDLHSGTDYRINVQFCFDEDFSVVREKILNNKLFNVNQQLLVHI